MFSLALEKAFRMDIPIDTIIDKIGKKNKPTELKYLIKIKVYPIHRTSIFFKNITLKITHMSWANISYLRDYKISPIWGVFILLSTTPAFQLLIL